MGNMTHYMGLLAANQPWNLIIFMAIPVICAETITITELGILFTRNLEGTIRRVNKMVSIFAGCYFTGIFVYLIITAYIPLTVHGQWRGWIDITAVTFYLLGIVPLLGMALLDLGLINRGKNTEQKIKIHSVFVGMFLIVAHVAMIFGMVDPSLASGHLANMGNMKM